MNKSEIEFANEQAKKMNDLISRGALIEKLEKSIKWCEDNLESSTASFQSGCIAAIKDLISTVKMEETCPSIDAVPIVRCKDCIHARKLKDSVCVWKCSRNYLNTHAVDGNDFCSYGKRKENNI